ncbi:amidohydrolase family protein [Micromonospora sp. NPDC005113]
MEAVGKIVDNLLDSYCDNVAWWLRSQLPSGNSRAVTRGRPSGSASHRLPVNGATELILPISRSQGALEQVIIDCHGHYTTAPQAHTSWREAQQAAFGAGEEPPAYPAISDDEIRETIEGSQLRLMAERGIDLTIFSPRASAMGHHFGDEAVSSRWAQVSNDLIARVVELYPDNFIGVCQLPQSPGVPISHSVAEMRRCVLELGFVGCNLNPDASGGHWTSPPLTDRSWYPFYEAMAELQVPAMVHVSAVINANFHATGSHYLNADTTAFMQFLQSDLFKDFPDLRFVIPHGGGAVPYHWGRFRGLADMLDRPALNESIMNNVFFDTCVYHQPGIDLLFSVIGVDNILFGSEMVGAVRGIDPQTGHHFDDTLRYVDALHLAPGDREKVYERNARRVYPRLDAALKARNR